MIDITDIFKALCEITRLRILNLIIKKEACVCEIEGVLNLTQSNASKHLGVLKKAGIIDSRKVAQWVYYRINSDFMLSNKLILDYIKNKFKNTKQYQIDLLSYQKFVINNGCCKGEIDEKE